MKIYSGVTTARLQEIAPTLTNEQAGEWLARNEQSLNRSLDDSVRFFLDEDSIPHD